MLCILEIACSVAGVVLFVMTMTNGSIKVGSNKEVRGGPAYVAAALLTAVFPVALIAGCAVGLHMAQQGQQVNVADIDPKWALVDVGVIALFVIPALIILFAAAKPIRRKKKRRRPVEDEDYDDYTHRRRSDDDYADADDRPRRRRAVDDLDDEDDRPRRRPRADEDDDPPRRRRDDLDDRAR